MNCTQAHNLFDAHLDNELSGALAAEFGAHQLKCAACRRELALLEVAGRVIAADTDSPSLPGGFTDLVVRSAMREQAPRQRHRRWIVGVGATLAVAASLLLAVTVFDPAPPSAEPRVLGETHTPTAEEMRQNILDAARRQPEDLELQRIAETLSTKSKELVDRTKDRAVRIEREAAETMIRVLESIPTETPRSDNRESHYSAKKSL